MAADKLAVVRDRLAAGKPTLVDLAACAATLRLLAEEAVASGEPVRRVAVVGDLTSDLLGHAVACAIAMEGELPLIHCTPYGLLLQQCLDPGSDLHAFRPELAVLVPDWRQTVDPLPVDAPADSVMAVTQARVRLFAAAWSALEAGNCSIIQHTLVPPASLLRGVADRRSEASTARRVAALNDALLQEAAGRVTWLEADRLAAQVGLAAWTSPRFYHAGKLGFDPRFLPDYLPWLRGAWRAATGRAKKLLVLDLDDTLWGGLIGDDGVEGIALGTGHGARGEAFADWQTHLAQLGQRGVVLAVCSKNSMGLAVAGFDHPDSALRRSDFAAIVCSWDDKAKGLRRIAAELDLGLDAMVFADDNPAERSLVQQLLPEVETVDIGTDPAQFIARLEAGHWFDLQAYTEADLRRSNTYAARGQALAARDQAIDLAGYLQGLDMHGRLLPAQAQDLPRLAQMELKTNQFNLTTRRWSDAQLAADLGRSDRLVLAFHLQDRFGDHGLVASLVVAREGDAFRIDSWLMSCRVFSRTAEQFIVAELARLALQQGAAALIGEYIPTARNGVVADLYQRLGFAATGSDGRFWRRELAAPRDDLASAITSHQA